MLGDIIGKNSGLFLDLAVYSIIAENNAGQYYPDYAYNHPLFTDRMKIYSDTKVSDFINSITRDQSLAFLDGWNEKQDHRQKIYISYDSTNKNCQAGDIDFVEYGHPKEDKGAPVINYSIAYDRTNAKSLYYEDYPGSIVDVSQLQYTLERAGGYGYRNVGFIRQTKRNVISTFFIVTERKAWNMRLLKQRLTEWPNAFISMKAQSMRSKAEVLPDTLT